MNISNIFCSLNTKKEETINKKGNLKYVFCGGFETPPDSGHSKAYYCIILYYYLDDCNAKAWLTVHIQLFTCDTVK